MAAIKLFNAFFGLIAVIMAVVFIYAFFQPMLTLANGQPTNEMKMLAYGGIVITLIFMLFIGPISNFIADDTGNM